MPKIEPLQLFTNGIFKNVILHFLYLALALAGALHLRMYHESAGTYAVSIRSRPKI